MFNVEQNPSAAISGAVSQAPAAERQTFVRRTYVHLLGAVLAFIGLEFLFFQTLPVERIARALMSSPWNWLLVLGLFMVVGFGAQRLAMSRVSPAMQYLGLGLYVALEAAIFMPILWVASNHYPGVIGSAALTTISIFCGLTGFVWMTGHDFSWLRGILFVGMMAALLLIVGAMLFGFNLGLIFTVLMIALASGYILYETSNVLLHYRTDEHVAASLGLFASVALLFWYVLRLYMYLQQD